MVAPFGDPMSVAASKDLARRETAGPLASCARGRLLHGSDAEVREVAVAVVARPQPNQASIVLSELPDLEAVSGLAADVYAVDRHSP